MVMSLQPNITPGIAIWFTFTSNGAFLTNKNHLHRKQGGWGNFDKGRHRATIVAKREGHVFQVDSDSCFGCAACVALCPLDALRLEGLLAVVDQGKCTHCDHCIPACPVHALAIIEEVDLPGNNRLPELVAQ